MTMDPCVLPENEKPIEPVMGVPQAPPFSKDAYWPLVSSEPPIVAYRKQGGGSTPGVGTHGRQFMALRKRYEKNKYLGEVYHGAIDLYAKENDSVIAIEDGEITRFVYFYLGTWGIVVKHMNLTVIYGEVSGDSLYFAGLAKKTGPFIPSSSQPPLPVKAGQVIGRVIRNTSFNRSSMLHVEVFDNNYRRNVPWGKGKPNPHRGLYDPSLALLKLARCGKRASGSPQASLTSSTSTTVSPLSDKISQEKFGTLTIVSANGISLKPFRYTFSAEDALWTAKFIMGEAGGRDNIDNRAVIWAMFNRYALFTNRYYDSFQKFLRAYSTPLQPVLKSPGAAARHYQKKEYIKTGGYYDPPYSYIPKGLLRRHKMLQEMRWSELAQESRNLAVRALKGLISNPIGNATEFASTLVYFRQAYKREPTDDEWRKYTEDFARKKNWKWIGSIANLDQKDNAFFIQKRRLMPGDKNSPLLTDLTFDIVKVI
jgi:murein DD-endopeptidase MepM/ murein hydrolase activator NlpD